MSGDIFLAKVSRSYCAAVESDELFYILIIIYYMYIPGILCQVPGKMLVGIVCGGGGLY